MSVRSEIETILANWAASHQPPLKVAYENVNFEKPKTSYLEIFMLDSVTHMRNLKAEGRVTGLFQINCYAPLSTGMRNVESMANEIIALYPVLPKTGEVSIEAPLDAGRADVIDNFIRIPITGKYRVEL